MDWIRAIGRIPAEARSAGAGLQATSDMVNQATAKPAPPAPPAPTSALKAPQDLAREQGPYGSRPGEVRLDSQGNPISGFSGVKRRVSPNGGI